MAFARVSRAMLSVVVVLGLTGASALAQQVTYNALPGTDFSKYKTYKWIAIAGALHPDQIVDQQIKQAIDAQLTAKGLTKTQDENADLYVGYQVAVNQEKQWNGYYGIGDVGWRMGGMGTATSSTIHIGTVGVDIYDRAIRRLVWRGSASKTIDARASPEKRQRNINKAAAKLFKKYPPPTS